MRENNVIDEKKSLFTAKKIMRVLTLLCTVFVFCPSFLVSCSGQNIEVSAMTAVGGVSMYGEKVVESHPIMLVCLLLPITILVLLFLKKFSDKKTVGIILGCIAVDLIIWIIFRATVKKLAEENYCTFETTGWYVLNIIVMLLMIIISALVVLNRLEMDTDLFAKVSCAGAQGTLNQMLAAVSKMPNVVTQMAGNVAANAKNKNQKENVIGFCEKCGSAIVYGCKFCTTCGTAVPESMIAEAENAKKATEEAVKKEAEAKQREKEVQRTEEEKLVTEKDKIENDKIENDTQNVTCEAGAFCQNCGSKLNAEALFCETCGIKIG